MLNNNINSFNELENRCLEFSLNVKVYCQSIKQDIIHQVYISQLIRASSSIGANYIEANEKLGPKDLLHRMRIARKESKETIYWLHHFTQTDERENLINESD